jgi:hypothetical protein
MDALGYLPWSTTPIAPLLIIWITNLISKFCSSVSFWVWFGFLNIVFGGIEQARFFREKKGLEKALESVLPDDEERLAWLKDRTRDLEQRIGEKCDQKIKGLDNSRKIV